MGKNAVLVLAFNRPERTAQLLEKIQQLYRPRTLYLAVDGPRAGHPTDAVKVGKVAALAESIPAEIRVHKLTREKNLGCRRAVSEAITWFFRQETAGIILEDDINPSRAFFDFCDEGLQRFENDPAVFHINGYLSTGSYHTRKDCLYRTTFPHVWGWATWRRAWNFYDDACMEGSRSASENAIAYATTDPDTRRFYDLAFELTRQGKLDSWAFRWMLSSWRQAAVAIAPSETTVTNVGIGPDSTHSRFADHLEAREQTPSAPPPNAPILDDHAFNEQFHRYFHQSTSRSRLLRMQASTFLPNRVHRFLRHFRG